MKQFAFLYSLLSMAFTSLVAQQHTSEQLLIPVKKKHGVFGDSLVSAEFANARNTKHIIDNLANIDYETLRELVSKLPALTYQQRYLSAVTNQVCMKRPELFFRLADDLPDKKQEMFYAVDRSKETMTKLRSVETDSASKKEFFKKS